jgi:hypothetical protein
MKSRLRRIYVTPLSCRCPGRFGVTRRYTALIHIDSTIFLIKRGPRKLVPLRITRLVCDWCKSASHVLGLSAKPRRTANRFGRELFYGLERRLLRTVCGPN